MKDNFSEIFEAFKIKETAKPTKVVVPSLFSAECTTEEDKLLELKEWEVELERLRKHVFKMRRELGK